METYQNIYQGGGWRTPLSGGQSQLVLLFGDRTLAADNAILTQIHQAFPLAEIIGCTTAGEISGAHIYDETLCLTAITFATSRIKVGHSSIGNDGALGQAIQELSSQIDHEGLKYVLVLSDGQKVNGTELISKLTSSLPEGVCITGGLAGDGTQFSETVVWHNEHVGSEQIVVCGFYGDNIGIGHGSVGGWDAFGPERLITKSNANILYSLDDQPALELYKKYLGDHASELPASALLYPLRITNEENNGSVIRTILNVNEQDNSMIFAGDIPEGASAQLMMANFDRLIDGAENAAESAKNCNANNQSSGVALLVSCVGRRLVLNQRTEEELEAVLEVLGPDWAYTGFYSYGEISPMQKGQACALHNQTMTITTIFETNA